MTLSNGLLTENAVYLWADTALWLDRLDGSRPTILTHQPKMIIGQDWPFAAVTAGTGPGMVAVALAIDKVRPASYGELVHCVQSALAPLVGKSGEQTLIASFEGRPRLTLIDNEEWNGYQPLTALGLGGAHLCSGDGVPEVEALMDEGITPDNMRLAIRAQHGDIDNPHCALFAGMIGRATVTREGVTVEIVDELPDPFAART